MADTDTGLTNLDCTGTLKVAGRTDLNGEIYYSASRVTYTRATGLIATSSKTYTISTIDTPVVVNPTTVAMPNAQGTFTTTNVGDIKYTGTPALNVTVSINSVFSAASPTQSSIIRILKNGSSIGDTGNLVLGTVGICISFDAFTTLATDDVITIEVENSTGTANYTTTMFQVTINNR